MRYIIDFYHDGINCQSNIKERNDKADMAIKSCDLDEFEKFK